MSFDGFVSLFLLSMLLMHVICAVVLIIPKNERIKSSVDLYVPDVQHVPNPVLIFVGYIVLQYYTV